MAASVAAMGAAACDASRDVSEASPACRRIADEIATGGLTWGAAIKIRYCPGYAGEVIPPLWRRASGDSARLATLLLASTGVLDRRILAAATRASRERQLAPNVRAGAVVVMGRYVSGDMVASLYSETVNDTVVVWPEGGDPLSDAKGPPAEYAAQFDAITARIERVAREDPHPRVRGVAERVVFWVTEKRKLWRR